MLKFRKLSAHDLELLRRWRMSPSVTKYLLTDPTITEEEQKTWFKNVKDGNRYRCWIANYDGADIGFVTLSKIDWDNYNADPGMYICEEKYIGVGLAKPMMHSLLRYAFEIMDMRKVFGPILVSNASAVAAYIKAGFKIEGYFRDHVYKNDIFHDVVMVAITSYDWHIMRKIPAVEFEEY